MRHFRLSNLFWLILVAALGIGWYDDHRRLQRQIRELDPDVPDAAATPAGAPPAILTCQVVQVEPWLIVAGKATGDFPTMLVEIDGVSSSAVACNATGNFSIDLTGYTDFVDLIAVDINGVSQLFTCTIP